jgi:hypothetical protein
MFRPLWYDVFERDGFMQCVTPKAAWGLDNSGLVHGGFALERNRSQQFFQVIKPLQNLEACWVEARQVDGRLYASGADLETEGT